MSGGKLRNWECLAVLRSVSAGTRRATPDRAPRDVFAGNVTYTTDDGWTIVVFNDCDSWDYVEAMRAPDGRQREFTGRDPPFNWSPDDAAMAARWGWPARPTLASGVLAASRALFEAVERALVGTTVTIPLGGEYVPTLGGARDEGSEGDG